MCPTFVSVLRTPLRTLSMSKLCRSSSLTHSAKKVSSGNLHFITAILFQFLGLFPAKIDHSQMYAYWVTVCTLCRTAGAR